MIDLFALILFSDSGVSPATLDRLRELRHEMGWLSEQASQKSALEILAAYTRAMGCADDEVEERFLADALRADADDAEFLVMAEIRLGSADLTDGDDG